MLTPSIYRDPAVLLPQNLGTDLVTLMVGIRLLAAAAMAMPKGSLTGRVVWLGALGVRWNQVFLLYVALFGLSLFALIIGLVGTDAGWIRGGLIERAPVRSVAAYLIAIAVMVAAMRLAEEVGALLHGTGSTDGAPLREKTA